MCEYGTGQANHGAIDASKKIMFGNATDLLVLEVLSPYRLQDLGSEE